MVHIISGVTACANVPAPTDTGCSTYDNTDSCCTQQNPCNKGEGDCDNDHDCKGHLICKENSCFHNLGFPEGSDCCAEPYQYTTGCHYYDGTSSCCTSENPCNKGEGDCDYNIDCVGNLVCGDNNCHDDLGFPSWGDCCEEPTQTASGCDYYNGSYSCCTKQNPCNIGEGNCSNNDDCKGNLVCGDSNCDHALGFPGYFDCCEEP